MCVCAHVCLAFKMQERREQKKEEREGGKQYKSKQRRAQPALQNMCLMRRNKLGFEIFYRQEIPKYCTISQEVFVPKKACELALTGRHDLSLVKRMLSTMVVALCMIVASFRLGHLF